MLLSSTQGQRLVSGNPYGNKVLFMIVGKICLTKHRTFLLTPFHFSLKPQLLMALAFRNELVFFLETLLVQRNLFGDFTIAPVGRHEWSVTETQVRSRHCFILISAGCLGRRQGLNCLSMMYCRKSNLFFKLYPYSLQLIVSFPSHCPHDQYRHRYRV